MIDILVRIGKGRRKYGLTYSSVLTFDGKYVDTNTTEVFRYIYIYTYILRNKTHKSRDNRLLRSEVSPIYSDVESCGDGICTRSTTDVSAKIPRNTCIGILNIHGSTKHRVINYLLIGLIHYNDSLRNVKGKF